MKKILFSEFNHRIKFGKMHPVRNDNTGDNDEMFVPELEVWCKPQKRTANQSYSIYGTDLEGTEVIVIRHNEQVKEMTKASYGGKEYDIVVNNPDESGNYLAYDYITLKLSQKVI
ncbi:phage head closure protein [Pediococcus acidilactici]|uniref:phage head closure protein n=1 Tax=Pediococcus acidilactici TaxID=1254 RepID=UPI00232DFF15|nr:phage head closure protein [Pediococcus acidilactici]MDB8867678.1 phage head closure protein [Pediococcus acidilactici]